MDALRSRAAAALRVPLEAASGAGGGGEVWSVRDRVTGEELALQGALADERARQR